MRMSALLEGALAVTLALTAGEGVPPGMAGRRGAPGRGPPGGGGGGGGSSVFGKGGGRRCLANSVGAVRGDIRRFRARGRWRSPSSDGLLEARRRCARRGTRTKSAAGAGSVVRRASW